MATRSTASGLWVADAGDLLSVRGRVRISTLDLDGRLVDAAEWSNLITTAGRQLMAHVIGNDPGYVGAQYVAVGTSGTAPLAGDTALGAELARAPLTQTVVSGSTSVTVTVNIFFTSSQAIGTWAEVGVFGNGATATAGSGTLMGHALVSYVKDSSHQAIVSYTFTLA